MKVNLFRFENENSDALNISGISPDGVAVCIKGIDEFNDHKLMLEKLVSAVGQDLNTSVVIIVAEGTFLLSKCISEHNLRRIISFGFRPEELMIQSDMMLYRNYRFEGFSLVMSEALSTLAGESNKKKILWNSLKGQFKL